MITPREILKFSETDAFTNGKNIRNFERINQQIEQSAYVSRDLSWLEFNRRVLDQARNPKRSIFDCLKFLAITASNLDEFFMIRVGSLYNYIDYEKERVDYSGLRAKPFKKLLFQSSHNFYTEQYNFLIKELIPNFEKNGFDILRVDQLTDHEREEINLYFLATIFPMLTPMTYDNYRSFPILSNKSLHFGVVTKNKEKGKEDRKLSFIQIPQNLARFYEFDRADKMVFVPIEEIIKTHITKLFRNIEILNMSLFRITRNGDITLEESDDIEDIFLDEIKKKIKTRKTGRVVRIEAERGCDEWTLKVLKKRWDLEEDNVFLMDKLIDLSGLFQIANHEEFSNQVYTPPSPVTPLFLTRNSQLDIFETLKQRDLLLHHPYNSFESVLDLLERAAIDSDVLAIKITIYRLARNSRISNALLKAAENGKHVSVLFELKARFDEENNIREAERLQKAGCFVIYGVSHFKTHTKMMLIVRKEDNQIVRYVHISSGNYNESTSKLYSDISLLTTQEVYAHDVSEFFNVITGHSQPNRYERLITSPFQMRDSVIKLIQKEAENAQNGLESGIVIKINSLEDQKTIDELYKASQAGVTIKFIVRGICCIRPQRAGLSENITVKSIIGDFLEHSRIFYFHNEGNPIIYGSSADMMVRSYERRIESMFMIEDEKAKKLATAILECSLKDNQNSYVMQEDGSYLKYQPAEGEPIVNVHKDFFKLTEYKVKKAKLF